MDINRSSRSQLKAYFIKHAIPSESQFSELIDGLLNQRDDRVVKPAGGPLSLEVTGDAASRRQVLHLYESFDDANPTWALTMNPRATVSDPATARQGLSIDDASGVSRLFIDHATGQVGIGTLEPQAALHVDGDIICSGTVTAQTLPTWTELVEAGTLQANLPQVELMNSWRPHNTVAGFIKDNFGIVYLKGMITAGTTADGTTICEFPPDIVVESVKTIPTWAANHNNSTLAVRMASRPSGPDVCELIVGGSVGVHISLDGVCFSTV